MGIGHAFFRQDETELCKYSMGWSVGHATDIFRGLSQLVTLTSDWSCQRYVVMDRVPFQ